ncbi:CvpA family protein [Porcipelethomonas sp.]|uniref:CvpA family protein n=1 Tax=Porcipelethomonas sp. TaxID=2981675 RepID=UPI003EF8E576
MGAEFWWIYDIISVVVIIFFVANCARKGFSKIIIVVIGCVLSIAAAWIISSKTTDFIYDKFVKKDSIEIVEKTLDGYNPSDVIRDVIESQDFAGNISSEKIEAILHTDNILDTLYDYANSQAGNVVGTSDDFDEQIINGFTENFAETVGINLPPYVVNEITTAITGNEELFNSTVRMIADNPDDLPEFIEENYIRQPAKRIIKAAVFLIVYFILTIIIRIVINRTFEFGLLNGYDRLDRFMGGILGFVEAIAAVIIIAVAVKVMINISESENSLISVKAIEQTKIFRHFYNFI